MLNFAAVDIIIFSTKSQNKTLFCINLLQLQSTSSRHTFQFKKRQYETSLSCRKSRKRKGVLKCCFIFLDAVILYTKKAGPATSFYANVVSLKLFLITCSVVAILMSKNFFYSSYACIKVIH
ncbi:hypothetical protein K1719_018375 [Acacia pycnantha]|nr:hypothetical protein K1719_018375 [Acacia pycnantha]